MHKRQSKSTGLIRGAVSCQVESSMGNGSGRGESEECMSSSMPDSVAQIPEIVHTDEFKCREERE